MPFFTCILNLSPDTATSAPSKRSPKYSFNWAWEIVGRAAQSHARVWKIFLLLIGLTERQLAFLICCDAPEWPQLRSMLQQLEKWQEKQHRLANGREFSEETPSQMLSSLLHIKGASLLESLRRYLTDRKNQLRMKEQVKKGEGAPLAPSNLFPPEEICEREPASEFDTHDADLTLRL